MTDGCIKSSISENWNFKFRTKLKTGYDNKYHKGGGRVTKRTCERSTFSMQVQKIVRYDTLYSIFGSERLNLALAHSPGDRCTSLALSAKSQFTRSLFDYI